MGLAVQSPIKLTQDKREFGFEFCNFVGKSSEKHFYARKIHTFNPGWC